MGGVEREKQENETHNKGHQLLHLRECRYDPLSLELDRCRRRDRDLERDLELEKIQLVYSTQIQVTIKAVLHAHKNYTDEIIKI